MRLSRKALHAAARVHLTISMLSSKASRWHLGHAGSYVAVHWLQNTSGHPFTSHRFSVPGSTCAVHLREGVIYHSELHEAGPRYMWDAHDARRPRVDEHHGLVAGQDATIFAAEILHRASLAHLPPVGVRSYATVCSYGRPCASSHLQHESIHHLGDASRIPEEILAVRGASLAPLHAHLSILPSNLPAEPRWMLCEW